MRKLFLNASVLASSLTAWAVAPYPGPVKYTQPDGSQLEVSMKGNSHSIVYYSTANGQPMLPDENGMLVPVTEEVAKATHSSKSAVKPKAVGNHSSFVPTIGSPRLCVILVEFKDVKFTTPDARDYYNRMLNQWGFTEDGGVGSVHDYYMAQSGNKFSPLFEVYGPVTLDSNRSSYASTSNAYKMVHEAAEALDSKVDFATYDIDGDGNVDNVFVIFAGQGANFGAANAPNPHNSECPTGLFSKKTVDGKTLYHYACVSENGYFTDKPDGTGTFIHEFGHVLGLPDLYNTDAQNDYTPGYWSIMDLGNYLGNGYSPCNYSAFERNACGWLDYTELTEPAKVMLRPMADRQFACKIETGRQGDYYVLENRRQDGWDRDLYGQGMLIWHIDASDANAIANNPNNDTSHMRIDLIEADGAGGKSRVELLGDPWPGVMNKYTFNGSSKPAMVRWNASTGSETTPIDKPLTSIFQFTYQDHVQFNYCGGSDEVIIDPDVVTNSLTVSVKAAPSVGGKVYLAQDETLTQTEVQIGSEIKLNAVPNDNYGFSNWSHNGVVVAYNRAPAITITDSNYGEYVANFYKISGGPDYCYPEGNATRNDNHGVNTFTVSDSNGNSVTVNGPGCESGHVLYVDRTTQSLTTTPGAILTFDGTSDNESWMHSYVYIDFDGNGEFDVDQSDVAINGDLISHTGYNLTMKSDGSDTDDPTVTSDGSAANMNRIFNLPSYQLPADLAPGTYRLRFKNDWNSTDPCGRSADHLFGGQRSNYMAANGGCVIDLNLTVIAAAAIDNIIPDGTEDDEVTYYNLEGVRINAENLTTGLYIVRKGNKSYKVFIER